MAMAIVEIVCGIVMGGFFSLLGISSLASLRDEGSLFSLIVGIVASVCGVAMFVNAIINIVNLATGQGA